MKHFISLHVSVDVVAIYLPLKGEFATKLWPNKVINYKFLSLKP